MRREQASRVSGDREAVAASVGAGPRSGARSAWLGVAMAGAVILAAGCDWVNPSTSEREGVDASSAAQRGAPGTSPQGTSSQGTSPQGTPIPDTPAADRLVLRRGNLAEPNSLDPIKAAVYPEHIIVGDLFVGLFTENAFGDPTPAVVAGWRVSEDGLIWTFRLRDTQWSDGTPVTAEDFVYGVRRVLAPESESPFAPSLFIIEGAEALHKGGDPEALGVRALAADQLEIRLNYGAPYLPGLLADYSMLPAPRHVIDRFGDAWTDPANIVVNGAYTLADWRVDEHVVLRKNPRFYDAANVCFDDVIFYPISDFEIVEERVRAGELDANPDVPGDRINAVRQTLPDYVQVSPSLATTFITFNTREAPFSDVRVRQALTMAIEPSAVVGAVARSGQVAARAFVAPSTANYQPSASAPWRGMAEDARRAQAVRLLQEAGFGPDAPLAVVYNHRDTRDNPLLAEYVKSVWTGLADWVSVETVEAPTQAHYAKVLAGDFQVADATWLPDYNDPHGFLSPFLTDSGSVNLSGWSNPDFDALMAQSNTILDFNRRAQVLASAEAILLEQSPVTPVWHLVNASLVSPMITGWRENSTKNNRSRYLCRVEPDPEADGDGGASGGNEAGAQAVASERS